MIDEEQVKNWILRLYKNLPLLRYSTGTDTDTDTTGIGAGAGKATNKLSLFPASLLLLRLYKNLPLLCYSTGTVAVAVPIPIPIPHIHAVYWLHSSLTLTTAMTTTTTMSDEEDEVSVLNFLYWKIRTVLCAWLKTKFFDETCPIGGTKIGKGIN